MILDEAERAELVHHAAVGGRRCPDDDAHKQMDRRQTRRLRGNVDSFMDASVRGGLRALVVSSSWVRNWFIRSASTPRLIPRQKPLF